MKTPIAIILLIMFAWSPSHAQLVVGPRVVLDFASIDEGKQVLTARDEYVQRMSMFDRAVRMKTARDVTEAEFLRFVGQHALEWSDKEKEKITALFSAIQPQLRKMDLPFPERMLLVKTSGAEEAGAAYTRGAAIMLPTMMLAAPDKILKQTICHELFHVLSRKDPELREQLYAAIGFERCNELAFPTELEARKITNPDAPRNDHCIQIEVDGESHSAIPLLYSRSEKYDVARGGELFNYLKFEFLLVERIEGSTEVTPLLDERGQPRLVGLQQISGLFEQIGRNTNYIIHPEEILADNFAMLVSGKRDPASPEILDGIRKILVSED